MIKIKKFEFNPFQENTVLLWDDDKNCVIIDPAYYNESEKTIFDNYIKNYELKPQAIFLTHAHFDHIFGVEDCSLDYNAPIYMNKNEGIILESNEIYCKKFGLKASPKDFKTTNIENGDIIKIGSMGFEVITTPGHTPGGVSYLEKDAKILLSGDTLFAGCIGRTDVEGGDYDVLMSSIFTKLMVLDSDVEVIPGHSQSTNIGKERTTNPFLMPFNEPIEE